jgi:hypothetical protein
MADKRRLEAEVAELRAAGAEMEKVVTASMSKKWEESLERARIGWERDGVRLEDEIRSLKR